MAPLVCMCGSRCIPYCPWFYSFHEAFLSLFSILCHVVLAGPVINNENHCACCLSFQLQSLDASLKSSNHSSKSQPPVRPLNLRIYSATELLESWRMWSTTCLSSWIRLIQHRILDYSAKDKLSLCEECLSNSSTLLPVSAGLFFTLPSTSSCSVRVRGLHSVNWPSVLRMVPIIHTILFYSELLSLLVNLQPFPSFSSKRCPQHVHSHTHAALTSLQSSHTFDSLYTQTLFILLYYNSLPTPHRVFDWIFYSFLYMPQKVTEDSFIVTVYFFPSH